MVTMVYNLTFQLVFLPQEKKKVNAVSFSQRSLEEICRNTDTGLSAFDFCTKQSSQNYNKE